MEDRMIQIIQESITNVKVDAIVNAANAHLQEGGGVCGYIFQAAGSLKLQKACDEIGFCPTGNAVITPGFQSKAKYIIHAVGPIYQGGNHGESTLLYDAYKNALERAKEVHCHSIAFPLISAGIYGYPKQEAWNVALQACMDWLKENEYTMDILFTILDSSILSMGLKTLRIFENE